MSHFKEWFLMVMGLGLVAIAVQGIFRGWLPNGRNGFQQGLGVSHEDQPFGFWLFFCLYFGGGLYIVFYAVRLFYGHTVP